MESNFWNLNKYRFQVEKKLFESREYEGPLHLKYYRIINKRKRGSNSVFFNHVHKLHKHPQSINDNAIGSLRNQLFLVWRARKNDQELAIIRNCFSPWPIFIAKNLHVTRLKNPQDVKKKLHFSRRLEANEPEELALANDRSSASLGSLR